jgi:hydrogenase-4 component B
MSGILIKTGIYGLMRFAAFGLGAPRMSWGIAILAIGGVSSLLGVLYALMQHDIKRLLAYHSIENIGIILLGLGAGVMASASGRGDLAAIGVAAALYHVLNHAVFKSLLFLGAGSVVVATGTRQIEEYGGLLRRMPWTGLYFLVGAAAISALPPLNGFASEWLTFQSFVYGFRATPLPVASPLFPVAGALLALTSALAAACFVKAFGITFLALPRSEAAAGAREAPLVMLVPQAALAVLCVVLGLAPGMVVAALGRALGAVPGIHPHVEMVLGALAVSPAPGTLDRLAPVALALVLDARTEYTATAFSKPLMMIFRAVYRPTRTVDALAGDSPYFTREVRYHAEIEPTFERYIYGPLVRSVLRVADRMKVLQAGSLHAYLAYVIALVLILVLLVWWMG